MDDAGTVKLVSEDGCAFCIPISCCRLSEVIHSELECQEEASQDDSDEATRNQNNASQCITLSLTTSRIHSSTLRKVAEFLTHYEKEEMTSFEPPFDSEDIEEIVGQKWYANFISVEHSLLIDIISAANFLVSTINNLIAIPSNNRVVG